MPLTRSENMARIRGRDTLPELAVRRRLFARGVRYRLNFPTPKGRADLAIPARRFALFIDGCFWHGCPEHYVRPRSRNQFWDAKLRENVERDRRQMIALEVAGWTALRVWEHEIRSSPDRVVELVLAALASTVTARPDWRVVRIEVIDPDRDLERRHLERLLPLGATRIEERRRTTHKVGVRRRLPR